MTITRKEYEAIRQVLADSREWHAGSMRISSQGEVTARKDADKTMQGPHTERFFVGYADDLLKEAR